jgi:hypothetical protein
VATDILVLSKVMLNNIISYIKLVQCLMSEYHVGVMEGLLMVFLATSTPVATKLGFDNFYFPVVTLSDKYLKILHNLH